MIKDRILATLKFFDLQDIPLTAFEVHKYLLNDIEKIKSSLATDWEVKDLPEDSSSEVVTLDKIIECLSEISGDLVKTSNGYYYLQTRSESFVQKRLRNFVYGLKRERRIAHFGAGVRHLPFIRGVALGGSQAFGQYKEGSDIDLLVITDGNFLWLGRVFITLYFQLIGMRRYSSYIANRFCLNHYLSGPKQLKEDKNIYTAFEYSRLRPIYESGVLAEFRSNNLAWMQLFFANIGNAEPSIPAVSKMQRVLEWLLRNSLGQYLESLSHLLLLRHIRTRELIFVTDDELSFHPHNRKSQLFEAFFEGNPNQVTSIDIDTDLKIA